MGCGCGRGRRKRKSSRMPSKSPVVKESIIHGIKVPQNMTPKQRQSTVAKIKNVKKKNKV